jgi:hypothetical protein
LKNVVARKPEKIQNNWEQKRKEKHNKREARLQLQRNLLQERVHNGNRNAMERRELSHPLLPPPQKMMMS